MPDRRLYDYLPSILQEAAELRAFQDDAGQPETDGLWGAMASLWDEQFIHTASAAGLARWEAMIRLPPIGSLEERRDAILLRLRERRPFTLVSLLEGLDDLCGPGKAECHLDIARFELLILVPPSKPLAAVRAMLALWLPANILLDLEILYFSHRKMGAMTHRALSAFTHKGVRELEN